MEYYRPTSIVLQCGADSLACDRLGCFNLSIKAHGACVQFVKTFNVPVLVLGGGGYTIRNVSRCWAYETSVLLDTKISNDLPYNPYYEYFGPDYSLHPQLTGGSNREIPNQNSRTYLETLRKRVSEHLRLLQGAPSVQMQEIPPDLLGVVEGTLMDDMDREMEAMERDAEQDRHQEDAVRQREDEKRREHESEYFDNERDQERDGSASIQLTASHESLDAVDRSMAQEEADKTAVVSIEDDVVEVEIVDELVADQIEQQQPTQASFIDDETKPEDIVVDIEGESPLQEPQLSLLEAPTGEDDLVSQSELQLEDDQVSAQTLQLDSVGGEEVDVEGGVEDVSMETVDEKSSLSVSSATLESNTVDVEQ